MKTIALTKGFFAIVDDDVFPSLAKHRWHLKTDGVRRYAVRFLRENGKRKAILMHRVIMQAPQGMDVDHKDSNGLNNLRENLRCCTRSQNLCNRRKLSPKSSRFKGVHWSNRFNRWIAKIKLHGKARHLGQFTNEISAAQKYNDAAVEIHGEHALINQI